MVTSIVAAFAIALSSATHHNRPVPSAKSLATNQVEQRGKFAQHRQREISVVAIAVVESECGEAAYANIQLSQPVMNFVQGDDIDVVRLEMVQHRAVVQRIDQGPLEPVACVPPCGWR